MAHVIRNFERPAAELVERIKQFPPSTLHEAQGRSGALTSRIKPIYPGMRACGPAFTVSCHPGDNMMLITAISLASPGDILVVSAGDHPEQGGFGEVLSTACMAKGIVGLVTDAGVRDGPAIHARGFNVFCYGLCMKGTVKETLGFINHPIVIGGVAVRPGDIVSADDDGVVVVPWETIADVTAKSRAREDKEAEVMKALEAGGDILELSGIGKVLQAKGCAFA
ncbi:4-carboxy-4-hydroxy-2-oxoadipate aldolase/oxaloacetate decarboxylase [Chelatococcus asaccharovorans]|uniref:4-hydroxy-4-methyl-2-oxoglutarate aldolase n=1 Tax=Chelatococcus asaccharovorans TaxID=28210 RepID=A0A2V3U3D9_9HYPH|nr:4-carboxy-4-hydroxy-2-oxoadipate aldolase/oxaloacetate decarboxylase [Chelatococcus asaccharovorans]MBS7702797.1 4-carboxy-4-hydroxy-2-oxoadipate aldolase/oxaloacetate decarboxylase [Chelatococcus asaccharovorans]PXW57089.1 4-hydroxy-4-methyl-2-oxoglutarate aldolase [Chelatococcus asaccharovorans]CAH1672913.1 4-carboxy-4-hydroxy-2-oxoadipate aldolase [Chelatococcus asaccharovorans]CAH1675698.1 4-carboxy-4-hydroxy-2-oxoadipate aldolase [Chelatococcus asaccharovorans]